MDAIRQLPSRCHPVRPARGRGRAQFKGQGLVNGAPGYGFLLTAVDRQRTGGGGTDRLRLKVWDRTTGAVVYDTQRGESETNSAATALGSGSVVVHR